MKTLMETHENLKRQQFQTSSNRMEVSGSAYTAMGVALPIERCRYDVNL